jgi:hypothetical protein
MAAKSDQSSPATADLLSGRVMSRLLETNNEMSPVRERYGEAFWRARHEPGSKVSAAQGIRQLAREV